ncbi:phosphorylase [Glycomyces sp. NPDC047010]|uniref:5'-methylthioadenosine/S-adenosylhomocysteine nucleosidase family protein n=1 Tax=Glycomyces sp. NPDC047010 TaxID=3155023 RepID=UPI0034057BBD
MTTLPTAVICTPLNVEYAAVADLLGHRPHTTETRGGSIYELHEFRARRTSWRLVLALTGRRNEETSAAVERAVQEWAPQVLMLVGVAGGLRESRVGDVVAATKVYGYEGGQDTDLGWLQRPDALPTSHALDQLAQQVSREGFWIWRAEPDADAPPPVHHRPIASGSKVVTGSSSYTADRIRESFGDAYAIDMEGFGAMAALRRSPSVQATVVRGVSDVLDDKDKDADRLTQPMAARRAAAFALALLDRFDPEPADAPAAAAPPAPVYNIGAQGPGATSTAGAIGNGATGQVVQQPYRYYEGP